MHAHTNSHIVLRCMHTRQSLWCPAPTDTEGLSSVPVFPSPAECWWPLGHCKGGRLLHISIWDSMQYSYTLWQKYFFNQGLLSNRNPLNICLLFVFELGEVDFIHIRFHPQRRNRKGSLNRLKRTKVVLQKCKLQEFKPNKCIYQELNHFGVSYPGSPHQSGSVPSLWPY